MQEFKTRVRDAETEDRIDVLCIEWLKELARDCGKEGKTAESLLKIVEDLLDIS